MINNWNFLDQCEVSQFLDKIEEAGVRHLAFGGTLPVKPDPRHYKDSVVRGQEPPPEIMSRETQVRSLLREAKDRGTEVYFYGTNPHMSGVRDLYKQLSHKRFLDGDHSIKQVGGYWQACANGPELLPYYLGRIRDAHSAFPEVAGFLNDGPEFGYEIDPAVHGNNWSVFTCFGTCCERKAEVLGYDFDEMRGAASKLRAWFLSIELGAVEEMINHQGEPLQALATAVGEPRLIEWCNFKRDSIVSYIKGLYQGIKKVDNTLKLGVGSRLPAFRPLTAYDLGYLATYADFLLPKLHLWMGGYDGLYGTVYRWVKMLKAWNPRLSDGLLFQFVYKLFGFRLPEVENLKDIEKYIDAGFLDRMKVTWLGEPFPKRFFTEVVTDQVRKMVHQVGDAWRVRPWVDTHHGGRVMTPNELDLLLSAAESGGLKTYLYYCDLENGEWEVALKHANGSQK